MSTSHYTSKIRVKLIQKIIQIEVVIQNALLDKRSIETSGIEVIVNIDDTFLTKNNTFFSKTAHFFSGNFVN